MADDEAADLLRQRLDPLLQRVALIGEGELRAVRVAAFAMPQAIERLFATPMIRPRLPRIRPDASAMLFPAPPRRGGGFLWHRALAQQAAASRATAEYCDGPRCWSEEVGPPDVR